MQTVANLMRAYGVENEVAEGESQRGLRGEQIATLRTERPFIARTKEAAIQGQEAQTALDRTRKTIMEKMSGPELAKALADVDFLREKIKSAPGERERVAAETTAVREGNTRANRQLIDLAMPNPFDDSAPPLKTSVPSTAVAEMIKQGWAVEEKNEERTFTRRRQEMQDDARRREEAAKSEANIQKGTTSANVVSEAEVFNSNSTTDYVYITPKSDAWVAPAAQKAARIVLPRETLANGKSRKLTARGIYEKAHRMGMTVEEYLDQILFKGVKDWRTKYAR